MVTFGKSLQLCIDINISKNELVAVLEGLKLPYVGIGKLSVGFTDTLYVLVYHYKSTT